MTDASVAHAGDRTEVDLAVVFVAVVERCRPQRVPASLAEARSVDPYGQADWAPAPVGVDAVPSSPRRGGALSRFVTLRQREVVPIVALMLDEATAVDASWAARQELSRGRPLTDGAAANPVAAVPSRIGAISPP